ncbi:MAG TPA: glycoside hydrolase family 28 protein, partial [Terriglobales bacterium]|nr:glycoside hydrolase family 28 protein [Terriglobales bacterium]
MFDVRRFGAAGDGKTHDAPSINRALQAAAAAGGGVVHFPAGSYLCYSIHLQSRVTLHLEPGAVVLAASTPKEGVTTGGYDPAEPNPPAGHYQDYGHTHFHNSLIWGEGLHDVAITGRGLIWGKGLSRGMGHDTPRAEAPGVANKAIALKNCRNVLLRDFAILHGGHFGILATGVDNLTIDNLTIDTNRDGMDLDCCRNVRVSNCTVNSPWDDAICPKSSYALGHPRITENLTISNCHVTGCYEIGSVLDGTFRRFPPDAHVPRTGRIKFGTESNGGFRNITVSNCVFEGCNGIALESVDGALLEEVIFNGITMRDISGAPIFLRLGSRMRGPAGLSVGVLRRVILTNIVSHNAESRLAAIISGVPGHNIEDLKISDIYLHHRGGGASQMAALQPPELESKYPDPDMFGPMPAHGFFIRHARNIELSNVEIACDQPDLRPAFLFDSVTGADCFRLKAPLGAAAPVFALRNVSRFRALACRGVKDVELPHTQQTVL